MQPDDVLVLARAADLPLTAERAAIILPTFNAWLSAAAELNRKMSAAAYLGLAPITTFSHPPRP